MKKMIAHLTNALHIHPIDMAFIATFILAIVGLVLALKKSNHN